MVPFEFPYDPAKAHEAILARTRINSNRGSIDCQVMDGDRENPDASGVPGEMAGRDLFPDWIWTPLVLDGPDPGYDAYHPITGVTLDVKASFHKGAHLLVSPNQLPVKVDRLVSAIVIPEWGHVVRFVGWLTREMFTAIAASPCNYCGRSPESGIWVCRSKLERMDAWPT